MRTYKDLGFRLTRDGYSVSIARTPNGNWLVMKETNWGHYEKHLFDTGRSAWAYYRTNELYPREY